LIISFFSFHLEVSIDLNVFVGFSKVPSHFIFLRVHSTYHL
jgi:hypothetical protein